MVKLLILGTGSMAVSHATNFQAAPDTELVAAVETDAARREAFGKQFGIENLFADLESAIAWGEFDAVANVTPDAVHYPTTMRLIAAGKHVFCEKPLATSYPLALEMADAAEAKGIINMVNFTYRNSPALQKARELVRGGAIGEIRYFEASYLQSWLVSKAWGDWRTESRWLWRLSSQHGSKGVLGDVGVHIVDFASFGADTDIVAVDSRLKTFHKAEGDKIGEYPLDAKRFGGDDGGVRQWRARYDHRDSLRHRPCQRPDAAHLRHVGRHGGEDRRQDLVAQDLRRSGDRYLRLGSG